MTRKLYEIKVGDVGDYGSFSYVTITKHNGNECELTDKSGNIKNVYTSLVRKYFVPYTECFKQITISRSAILQIYNKHKIKLNNLKENRALDETLYSDRENELIDCEIKTLASIVGDLFKLLEE